MGPSSPVVVDLTTTPRDDEIEGCDTPGPAEIRRQRLAEFYKRRKAEKATGVKETKKKIKKMFPNPLSKPPAPRLVVWRLLRRMTTSCRIMFHGDVFICVPFFCKKLFNHVSLHFEVVPMCNWKSFLDMPRTHVHRSWNTAPKVLANIKN